MGSNRQTILDYLTETLFLTITTGNGYNFTLGLTDRGVRSFDELKSPDYPCLFVASADEQCKDISNGQFQSEMVVNIYGAVEKNRTTGELQTELDKLIEDIRKCLYADPIQGDRTGYTHILDVVTDDGDGDPHAFFMMRVKFSYQGLYTSP